MEYANNFQNRMAVNVKIHKKQPTPSSQLKLNFLSEFQFQKEISFYTKDETQWPPVFQRHLETSCIYIVSSQRAIYREAFIKAIWLPYSSNYNSKLHAFFSYFFGSSVPKQINPLTQFSRKLHKIQLHCNPS